MHRSSLIIIGIAQFAILLVALVRAKVFSILLGPGGLGVVSTIDQLVVTLTHIGAFGLPYTALKFMSAKHSISQQAFRRSYAIYMRAILILAILTATISVLFFSVRPDIIGAEAAGYSKEIKFALMGIAPFMLTILLSHTFASAQKPITAATFNLLSAGSLAGAAIFGVMIGGLSGLYMATAITGLVLVMFAIAYLQKTDGLSVMDSGGSIREEMSKDKGIFNTAASVYITMVGYSGCLLVVRFALFSHVGEVATGLLQSAIAVALSFGAILAAMINLSLAPILNRIASESKKIKLANEFAAKMLLLLFIGAIPIVLFPRTILSILYTNEFSVASTALVLCVFWQCLYQFIAVYHQLLIGINQVRYMAFSAVLGFIVSGILAIILVKPIGIQAGPIALIAGGFVSAACIFGRLILVNKFRLPIRILYRAVFVAVALFSAGVLFDVDSENTLSGIAVRMSFGAAMLGVVWALLDDSERKDIYSGFNFIKNLFRKITQYTL